MIERKTISRARRWALGTTLALAAASAAPLAQADVVMLKDSPLVNGSQAFVYSMLAPGSGSLSVNITDLNFPSAIAGLTFSFTTTQGVLKSFEGTGQMSLDISGAGTYYAIIAGTGQGKFGIGQLSLSVVFSPLSGGPGPAPVPVPAALVLLLSGLGGTYGALRQRSRAIAPAASSV